MKRAAAAALAVVFAVPALSQVSATGSMTYTPNGSSFDYDITLNNTGANSIDVFWYSWIPGLDFMTVAPDAYSAPAGWNVSVQGGTPGDGYSLEFTTTTAPLAAGASLSGFTFTSSETPEQLAATSPILNHLYQTGISYVYQGAPLASNFGTLVVNPVPEPMTLCALAPALLLMRRRRR